MYKSHRAAQLTGKMLLSFYLIYYLSILSNHSTFNLKTKRIDVFNCYFTFNINFVYRA